MSSWLPVPPDQELSVWSPIYVRKGAGVGVLKLRQWLADSLFFTPKG